MSLRAEVIGPVSEETARVAHAAFPRGSRYLRLRDELGVIYDDALFAPLFPERGRPPSARTGGRCRTRSTPTMPRRAWPTCRR